jgi:hypothetical protein
MPWVRIDDQFADHPKIVAAGPLASWLYICGLTYASRLLTDGFIPAGQVRKLADVSNAQKLADSLVRVGLWDVAEGGYAIHDYLEYNPSRTKTLATREARAEAGSLGGKQKASKMLERSQSAASESFKQNSAPSPTRPLPHPQEDTEKPPVAIATTPSGGKRATTRIPEDFAITPELREVAIEAGVPPEQITFETAKWRDHHAAKGDVVKDAAASWRTWMRNAPGFNRPRGSSNGNGASHFVTKQEQIDKNNQAAEAEFLGYFNGSSQNGSERVQRPDEPARRRLSD